jgi:thiamine-phosphate diphosphorylase
MADRPSRDVWPRPCVMLVTARRRLSPNARTVSEELSALERLLDEAIGAGADVIQVRERDLGTALLASFVTRLVARTRGTRTLVLVNDRADVAVAAGADGVHLRGDGPEVARVRALRAPPWIVGRSIHASDEARTHADADYFVFGSVYPGATKPAAGPVAGLAELDAAVRAASAPVVAIGGITPERAGRAVAAGAAGVAAIGVFLPEGLAPGALGPARAVLALRAAMDEEQKRR